MPFYFGDADCCNSVRKNKNTSVQSLCVALGIVSPAPSRVPSSAHTRGFLKDDVGVQNDNGIDPDYKFFLDHLRVDGTSYVFEVEYKEHGLVRIKYDCNVQNVNRASQCKMEHNFDDGYQKFLSCATMQNGIPVLEMQPGIIVMYEGDEGESSPPFAGYLPPSEQSSTTYEAQSGAEDDQNLSIVPSSMDSFRYKEKLVEVLSQPFDSSEYDKLFNLATERKPLSKVKHLRGSSISYETGKKGLSYLDHHPDLARQIEGADRRTSLNLLRGFFFWLKNLSHEGAFMPWRPSPVCWDMSSAYDCEMSYSTTI